MKCTRLSLTAAAFCAAFFVQSAPLASHPKETALNVTFTVAPSEGQVLSLADLDALPQTSFATSTIWTEERTTFSGVPLKSLLASMGIHDGTVQAIALNDYAVAIPVSELDDHAPIVATRMDGSVMSVRDKGPFWIVYPYDEAARYRTETTYSRSIWQLNRLSVQP